MKALHTDLTQQLAADTNPALLEAKGKGLNSIPIRFSLMSAVFTTACAIVQYFILRPSGTDALQPAAITMIAVTIALPAMVTFLAANRLAGLIRALRKSTEAITAGDFDSPVDIDCACEVGGLADSFRAMVSRLNSNIVRMNVLAYTDAVTGLPNRSVITHILGLASKMRDTDRRDGALLFIDLDNFKRVNDTLSHEAGDELLRQVSERIIQDGFGLTREDIDSCTTTFGELCQTYPTGIALARFAGDEFVALLPGMVDRAPLEARATRIVEALGKPFSIYGNEVKIGASIGIARMPVDTDNPEQLLSYADIAMYSAKQAGRNQYRFFDVSLREIAVERSQIEADLRKAVEAETLSLHFQPKLDTHTLELRGVEALVRWEHPEKGMIPPDKFIGIAEQSGMMPALGSSILRMAAQQARAWLDAGHRIPIAVNVSPVQFERPTLVSEILGVFDHYDIDPSLIEVELTETMVMSDFAMCKWRMDQLHHAGVTIAIDDFGTGYSNLSQFTRLPFNVLKIDRSLIDTIGDNPQSQVIVTAIVHMAHALGHKVVAEGIEKLEQHAFLGKIGCDQVQGFLFGRPMPAHEFEKWVRERTVSGVAAMQASLTETLNVA